MSEAIPLLLLSPLAAYVTTILPYIQTPIGAANFSLLQNIKTGSGTHPPSCSMGTISLAGGKAAGA